jgi:DNA-binding CsgD family transcriptional regulator
VDPDPLIEGSHIAIEDVRAVVRLIGSVADHGGTPIEKKLALMDGLCEMLEADAWLWVVSRFDPGSPPMAMHLHHGGLTERQLGLVFEASQDLEHPPPEDEAIARDLRMGTPFTRRREDWVPDHLWTGEHHRRYRSKIGIDEFLYGMFPIAGNLFSGIGLHRVTGRPGFTVRERQILHIVVTEIPWLHRAGLPASELDELEDYGRGVMDLSPRLRTVFGLLIQGWKRARIAEQLGISENTAKSHIRDVYRHFGVSDHVDLLRRFMATGEPIDPR